MKTVKKITFITFAAALIFLILASCANTSEPATADPQTDAPPSTDASTDHPTAQGASTDPTAPDTSRDPTPDSTSEPVTTLLPPPPLAEYGRLPSVYLTTNDGKSVTSKTLYKEGTLSLKVGDGTLYDSSISISEHSMQIKGRGHSSWKWPKKPYIVKMDKKISLFGLPASKDWIFQSNYSDKSLIRNHLASVMGNTLKNMDFVPRTVLVDVYFNGSYQGVYNISERIEIASGRLTLDERMENDTGYLIEIGGTEEGDVLDVDYFNTNSFIHAYVKNPKSKTRTTEQMAFITNYVMEADAAVISLTGYEEYIDIPSLIDWFILHELTYNLDSSFRRSCFMTKDTGGKLKMGPPWDFDLAFGNHFRYNNYPNVWASVSRKDEYVGVTWMDHLLRDPAFTSKLKARWNEVGDELMAVALNEIDLCEKVIQKSQEANFKTWNILGKKVAFEPTNIANLKTYEEQLRQMRDFLNTRKAWMDKTIGAF